MTIQSFLSSRFDETFGKPNFYRKLRYRAWQASTIRLAQGEHITRYYMYRHLSRAADKLPNRTGSVLSVSQSDRLIEMLKIEARDLMSADYPQYNMLSLPFDDSSFDFVISDQVLEHVEGDPQTAIDETHRVIRRNGIAIHTTCFINPIHGAPNDFWRFTPNALSLLHQGWSRIIDVGGWGNFAAWEAMKDGIRFLKVPHARWHPLHKLATKNEVNWPIVTWIIALK
jgi:SAM-dependent methyltransferase